MVFGNSAVFAVFQTPSRCNLYVFSPSFGFPICYWNRLPYRCPSWSHGVHISAISYAELHDKWILNSVVQTDEKFLLVNNIFQFLMDSGCTRFKFRNPCEFRSIPPRLRSQSLNELFTRTVCEDLGVTEYWYFTKMVHLLVHIYHRHWFWNPSAGILAELVDSLDIFLLEALFQPRLDDFEEHLHELFN